MSKVKRASSEIRGRDILFSQYLPVFSILIASLLILRGLNLGIPYLSPHFDIAGEVMDCCKINSGR